jgi:hypothetical protein
MHRAALHALPLTIFDTSSHARARMQLFIGSILHCSRRQLALAVRPPAAASSAPLSIYPAPAHAHASAELSHAQLQRLLCVGSHAQRMCALLFCSSPRSRRFDPRAVVFSWLTSMARTGPRHAVEWLLHRSMAVEELDWIGGGDDDVFVVDDEDNVVVVDDDDDDDDVIVVDDADADVDGDDDHRDVDYFGLRLNDAGGDSDWAVGNNT